MMVWCFRARHHAFSSARSASSIFPSCPFLCLGFFWAPLWLWIGLETASSGSNSALDFFVPTFTYKSALSQRSLDNKINKVVVVHVTLPFFSPWFLSRFQSIRGENISREILFFLLASPNLYFRCPSFFPWNVLRWPQKDTFDKKRLPKKNWTEETKDTFPRKPARVQDVLWANWEK